MADFDMQLKSNMHESCKIWHLAPNFLSLETYCLLLETYCLLLETYCLLLETYCQLKTHSIPSLNLIGEVGIRK
jgi:hypothetical protein